MLLRKATAGDLPFLLDLEAENYHAGFVGCDDETEHLLRMLDPDSVYWIVEQHGSPAGYVILEGLESCNRSVLIRRVAVTKPGSGLGRAVLREVMRIAFTELGTHRLWLDVYVDNDRARHVYQALGFTEEGTMRDCILQNGAYRSLVLMSLLEEEYRKQSAGNA